MTRKASIKKAKRHDRKEVVLAGVGGQGLVYIGRLLGEALVRDGFHAVQTQSYGVASRGGFTKSEGVFSSRPLAYPMVSSPDAVLALSQEAYDRLAASLQGSAVLIFDSDAVTEAESKPQQVGFPLTSTARELDLMGSYNLLALGAFMSCADLIGVEPMLQILKENSKSDRGKRNLRAFHRGLSLAD